MKNQCQHLKKMQRNKFIKLLQKIGEFFNGTLDTRKNIQ